MVTNSSNFSDSYIVIVLVTLSGLVRQHQVSQCQYFPSKGGESGPGEWKRYICGVVAGATWGTGIILDQNFVLTCSHVVKGRGM